MGKFLALLITGTVIAIVVSIASLVLSNLAAFILFLSMITVMRTEAFAIKIISVCERILEWVEKQENEKEE